MAPSFRLAESLVVDPGTETELILLNPAAALLWEGYADGLGVGELSDRLASRLRISRDEAGGQVRDALAGWRSAGLIERPTRRVASNPAAAARPVEELAVLPGRTATRCYDLCGTPIEVTFCPEDVERIFAPRFGYSPCSAAVPAHRLRLCACEDGFALVEHGAVVQRSVSEREVFGDVTRYFAELSYGTSDWLAVLHAGAVRTPVGRGLVLPGANGRGKSTLVTGLLAAGYEYLSDDCAPLTRAGDIAPIPFAICIKEGSWSVVAGLAGDLGAAVHLNQNGDRCRYLAPIGPSRRLGPIDAIVFPNYVAGSAPELRPVGPAETLARLLSSRAWLSRSHGDLAILLGLLERLPAFALTYGSLEQAVQAVCEFGAGQA